jgi:hypothetical protein
MKFQETEHSKSYILLCNILSMHIHTFIKVQHLPYRGLAGSVKVVHVVSEWEFTRLEFVTTGGAQEGLEVYSLLKYDGV